MNKRNIGYWIATALVCAMMAFSATLYLIGSPAMLVGFTHLGYPTAYFPAMLGIAKLLGVATLLAPRLPVLKEWAYAGFAFTLIAATVSHLASGDGAQSFPPVFALALLGVSYFLRPANRRLVAAPAATATRETPLTVS